MDTKIMVVGSAKTSTTGKRRPRIRLAGFWLDTLGFEYGSLVSIVRKQGSITLELVGKGTEAYSKVVKSIRRTDSGLIQVKREIHNGKETNHLELKGFWLDGLGFRTGSVIAVLCVYGIINIRLLDLEKVYT